MSLFPSTYPDESIDAYGYVENSQLVLDLLQELSEDIQHFYFTHYTHYGTPKYTMISVLVDSDGKIVEFYAESKQAMNYRNKITIPQEVIEAVKLVPKEAREVYLASAIKDAYDVGIKELSKPRG